MEKKWLAGTMFLLAFLGSTCFALDQPTAPEVKALTAGAPGTKPGDIILPFNDAQIAAWCDFTKQIVVTRTGVLCAYNGIVAAQPLAGPAVPVATPTPPGTNPS
jgi:hypothetical protein